MAEQVPSVGRDVHYVAYGSPDGTYPAGAHRAAKITTVEHWEDRGEVGLAIFNPTGLHFSEHVRYSTKPIPGTWHWPEFVPPRESGEP